MYLRHKLILRILFSLDPCHNSTRVYAKLGWFLFTLLFLSCLCRISCNTFYFILGLFLFISLFVSFIKEPIRQGIRFIPARSLSFMYFSRAIPVSVLNANQRVILLRCSPSLQLSFVSFLVFISIRGIKLTLSFSSSVSYFFLYFTLRHKYIGTHSYSLPRTFNVALSWTIALRISKRITLTM